MGLKKQFKILYLSITKTFSLTFYYNKSSRMINLTYVNKTLLKILKRGFFSNNKKKHFEVFHLLTTCESNLCVSLSYYSIFDAMEKVINIFFFKYSKMIFSEFKYILLEFIHLLYSTLIILLLYFSVRCTQQVCSVNPGYL